MSRLTFKLLGLALSVMTIAAHAADDLTGEMDALGANKDLMKKARAIDPENRVRVVQNRDVDRYNRLELGVSAALIEGGDSYVNTTSLGLNADYHVTPHWSLGLRYNNFSNSLSNEGKNVYDSANARRQTDPNYIVPKIDYAKDSYLAVINWYPIYGKLNLFDRGIAQFDMYLLGGAGMIDLGSANSTGSASLYTAGVGVGLWLTQHFTTRLEARWQGYRDLDSRNINDTVLSLSLGYLF